MITTVNLKCVKSKLRKFEIQKKRKKEKEERSLHVEIPTRAFGELLSYRIEGEFVRMCCYIFTRDPIRVGRHELCTWWNLTGVCVVYMVG